MPNKMLLIRPYKLHGTWVFDDERFGLVQEPFVLGASEMIDAILATLKPPIENADQGFRLLFSANPFPGRHAELVRLREESGGNWYQFEDGSMEGWLCPALFHYFPQAPDRIYARAEKVRDASLFGQVDSGSSSSSRGKPLAVPAREPKSQ